MIDHIVPELRRFEPDNLEAAAALEKQLFSDPWSLESLKSALSRMDSVYVECMADGVLAGYCGLYLAGDEGYINQVAVAPAFQGRGYGKRMLAFLLGKAEEMGMKACTLEVRVSNERAKRLYRSLDFKDSGIRPGFYDDPKEDALIMWRYETDAESRIKRKSD